MDIIPEVHLEEWEANDEETIFIKDNLKIVLEDNKLILFISDIENNYTPIKEITNYWELRSLDYFLNAEFNSDGEQDEYQREFSTEIRNSYLKYDYIVIHKHNNSIFGVNNLFDCDGWVNQELETLWERNMIDIIDFNDDEIYPLRYTEKGWQEIDYINKDNLFAEYRDIFLEDLI